MNRKITTGLMTILLVSAAMAGCAGEEESNLDPSDGGYEYASNVDNHRMLVEDVCDIKDLSEAHDWEGVKKIYQNGKHAEKSDGSYRTLVGFADATGKKHGLDSYYDLATPLDDFLISALDGTGMFEGASASVREQAVEKGVQNQIMVAYTIHELNSAISKAEAGNFGTNDAQHAWDEGWAFYHGLDEYTSCSPYATGDKRAGNFGTENSEGTAEANAAFLVAMNNGLTAFQAEDLAGATQARDEVLKNVIIIYSQATIRYAQKMHDDMESGNTDAAKTHQSEGLSFWRVIEAYVDDANRSSINDIYNLANEPISGEDYQGAVRDALRPAWENYGITTEDIGTLQ